MDILALLVDLILQSEVEMKAFHFLTMKDLDVGLVLLKLEVLDLVRKPRSQAIKAVRWKIN